MTARKVFDKVSFLGHLLPREKITMAFARTAKTNEITAGTIREFQVEGKAIALANVGGKYYAINNTPAPGRAARPGSPERNHRDLPLAWLGIRRHDREGEAEPGRGSRLLPGRGAGRRHLCRRWLICPYLDENKSDSLISKEAVALPSFHSEATLSRVDAYIFVSLFKHHRV